MWRFNTVPRDGEPGVETWAGVESNMRLGGGIWTTPSLDAEQGLLYVPVGNPAPDLIATARAGTNLYTGAMVVLDAHTGQLKWYKQTVPQDTHDWDVPVTAPLFTATIKRYAPRTSSRSAARMVCCASSTETATKRSTPCL